MRATAPECSDIKSLGMKGLLKHRRLGVEVVMDEDDCCKAVYNFFISCGVCRNRRVERHHRKKLLPVEQPLETRPFDRKRRPGPRAISGRELICNPPGTVQPLLLVEVLEHAASSTGKRESCLQYGSGECAECAGPVKDG